LLVEDREWITKVWGIEEVLVNNDHYCSKIMHLRHGYQSSLHYHEIKTETFFALAGLIFVEYYPEPGKKLETILNGSIREGLHLPAGTAHRFRPLCGDAMMLEVSTKHSDEDVVRLEPSREVAIPTD
jgi:mannose-6-phosphate isomerase-like protein (cupin superfamily)